MKASKFSEAQIAFVLKHAEDGTAVGEVCRKAGVSEATFYNWRMSKSTQGFEVLEDADLAELWFERIIVDHPEEFSPRALWYARKTLGLANESEKPPASRKLITQIRTEASLDWMRRRATDHGGDLSGYTNVNVGAVLGFTNLSTHGRVLGNITSRIDFACYQCGLPPLGLVADMPFANAWNRDDRPWEFPVEEMARAANTACQADVSFPGLKLPSARSANFTPASRRAGQPGRRGMRRSPHVSLSVRTWCHHKTHQPEPWTHWLNSADS